MKLLKCNYSVLETRSSEATQQSIIFASISANKLQCYTPGIDTSLPQVLIDDKSLKPSILLISISFAISNKDLFSTQ